MAGRDLEGPGPGARGSHETAHDDAVRRCARRGGGCPGLAGPQPQPSCAGPRRDRVRERVLAQPAGWRRVPTAPQPRSRTSPRSGPPSAGIDVGQVPSGRDTGPRLHRCMSAFPSEVSRTTTASFGSCGWFWLSEQHENHTWANALMALVILVAPLVTRPPATIQRLLICALGCTASRHARRLLPSASRCSTRGASWASPLLRASSSSESAGALSSPDSSQGA